MKKCIVAIVVAIFILFPANAYAESDIRYQGTFFETALYVEFWNGLPILYIFRHRPHNLENQIHEPIFAVAPNLLFFEDNFSGEVYHGTFFNVAMYLIIENGIVEYHSFNYRPHTLPVFTPTPIYTPQPVTPQRTIPTLTVDQVQEATQYTRFTFYIPEFILNHALIFIVAFVFLVLFAITAVASKSAKKRNAQKTWNEKFEEVKADARQARIDRGWLPDKYTDPNHKKWTGNPKLFKELDLALVNNDPYLEKHRLVADSYVKEHSLNLNKAKIACVKCEGVVTRSKNYFSGMDFYSCDNPECGFQVLDITDINPLKILNISEIVGS